MALHASGKTNKQKNKKGGRLKGEQKGFPRSKENTYEYSSAPLRRRPRMDLTAEEKSHGCSKDEDEDEEILMKQRLVDMVTGENTSININDDEDIDSEDAFQESDEERFAEFRFNQKNKLKKSLRTRSKFNPSISLQEIETGDDTSAILGYKSNSEEEESGDPSEFFDVLDVLDGKVDLENEPSTPQHPGAITDVPTLSGLENAEVQDSTNSESEHDGALERLNSFINKLPTNNSKRKAVEVDGNDEILESVSRKRITIREETEAGNEGDTLPRGDEKLSIKDLLAPLTSSNSERFRKLKADVEVLTSSKTSDGPLAVPLPQRTQDRISRDAAYQQTKEEVEKWQPTMKRIREAEHLRFPLQSGSITQKPSDAEMTARFKPSNDMESAIDQLLRSAHLREGELEKQEDLQMSHLTIEEVQRRRQELRQIRELMFRSDAKAKRVAKIKSRTYRKLQKKARLKEQEKLKAAGVSFVEEEDGDQQRLEHEIERARERATLRHRNMGKWAKAMKGKHGLDDFRREEISEQLDRGERLLEKIRSGDGSDNDMVDRNDESEDEISEERAIEELNGTTESIDQTESGKGIFSMKFMKQADARRIQAANQAAVALLSDMNPENSSSERSLLETLPQSGKMLFKPSVHGPVSESESWKIQGSGSATKEVVREPSVDLDNVIEETYEKDARNNPWLDRAESSGNSKVARGKMQITLSKHSTTAEKYLTRLQKHTSKITSTLDVQQDAIVGISLESSLTAKRDGDKIKLQHPQESEESDFDSEIEYQERIAGRARKKSSLKQRDLVAMAFAGDDVVKEFEEAKEKEIATDAPHEEDNSLPGWGSWAGPGVHQQQPLTKFRMQKKISGIEPSKRSDFNNKNVIISEKRDKKAAKFQVRDVPYPYTSRSQYEASIATPVGREWNTQTGFQRGTLPKVMKKPGVIIEALKHS